MISNDFFSRIRMFIISILAILPVDIVVVVVTISRTTFTQISIYISMHLNSKKPLNKLPFNDHLLPFPPVHDYYLF